MLPKLAPNTFLVIRTGGEEEVHEYKDKTGKNILKEMKDALGFTNFDFVRVGKAIGDPFLTMVVDDLGYESKMVERMPGLFEMIPVKGLKPVNRRATEFYLAICHPGTVYEVVGDVAIFQDSPD